MDPQPNEHEQKKKQKKTKKKTGYQEIAREFQILEIELGIITV